MFLHSWHPTAILATIGSLQIHWYGLTLAGGAFGGLIVLLRLKKDASLRSEQVFDLFLLLLAGGLIGARLYHVSNEWTYYSHHWLEIFKIWNGGLAIHGAIIAGLIVLWLYARRQRLSFWRIADVLAPALAIGQAIGRWGNYFNQELFGRPTTLPWGIPIDPINRPVGYEQYQFFHPTFLYESLGLLLIAIALICFIVYRSRLGRWLAPAGMVTMVYFLLTAVLRIGTEMLRIDRVPIIAGIRLPIISSVIIIVAALAIGLWFMRRQAPKPHDHAA